MKRSMKRRKKIECPAELVFRLLQERRAYWDESDITDVAAKLGLRYKKDVHNSVPCIDVWDSEGNHVARFLRAEPPYQDYYLFWINAGIEN